MASFAPLAKHSSRTLAGGAQRWFPSALNRQHASSARTSARTLGEISSLPAGPAIQAKLAINEPGDRYEQEADRVADQVMRMAEPKIQRACSCGGDCPECRRGKQSGSAGKPLRMKSASGATAPLTAARADAGPQLGAGSPLPAAAREFFEPRFGVDFAHVRVHTDAPAANFARAIHARAFTHGSDIGFAPGEYSQSGTGHWPLLAHELAHVVQQNSGMSPMVQRSIVECAEELANPPDTSLIAGGGAAIHQMIQEDFATKVGGQSVMIPGASAGPLRTEALCGGKSTVIPPQVIGGMAGAGFPDLAKITGTGILLVAEIKPAVVPCLLDGENQVLKYIDQGNATDPQQVAWRAGMGVKVVSPMLESTYRPPSFSLGNAEIESTWCSPGLLAYTIYRKGQKRRLPEVQPVGEPATEDQKQEVKRRLPSVPDWVWAAVGAAAVALIIACFASGVCELGAILTAAGEALGWVIINAMRLAGIAFAAG